MTNTTTQMRVVSMINGRAWSWEHKGYAYQVISLNGSDKVRLYYRADDATTWELGHSRSTDGHGARYVAQAMYADITRVVNA